MSLSLTHLKPATLLRRAGLSVLALFAACTLAAAAPVHSDLLSARARPITVAVIGDSVANDLGRGMQDLFADNSRIRVVHQTKFATGLVRTDYYDWNKVARDFLRAHKPNVVFVIMGGNDNQTIRRGGERYDPGTKAWRAEYSRLVSRFMNNFNRKHTRARIYWVSLPPVRSARLSAAYRTLNAIYRHQAKRHGFHYVSVWKRFLTPKGAYSSFGDNLKGVKRQLRMDDGQHFTDDGRLLFAHDVARAAGLL
jgi:hypothetical protein